jgi:DNA invertase Pin-like site-specific DNA recombinase
MKIGYARVSTEEQNLDLQLQALEAAGRGKIFEDHGISCAAIERPGLADALAAAAGDVLVVWKLDRPGRSLPAGAQTLAKLTLQSDHSMGADQDRYL